MCVCGHDIHMYVYIYLFMYMYVATYVVVCIIQYHIIYSYIKNKYALIYPVTFNNILDTPGTGRVEVSSTCGLLHVDMYPG